MKSFIKTFITMVLLTSAVAASDFSNTLYYHMDYKNNKIHLQLKQTKQTIAVNFPKFVPIFKKLYDFLDKWELTSVRYRQLAFQLYKPFIKPAYHLIAKSTSIRFIVDKHSISYAMEILPYKGSPLFLAKPIFFSFHKNSISIPKFKKTQKCLTIRDKTSDPENGLNKASKVFSFSSRYEMADINLKKLYAHKPHDVIILSLHGQGGDDANMDLNEEQITAQDLLPLKAKIIYLDSCQMGSTFPFIQKHQKNNTAIFLGPLFSNEAGESSTQTVQTFFSYYSKGLTPTVALFKTKRHLHSLYKTDDFETYLMRVAPFRIYVR